ncbi:MAG: hypothetical protein OHK0029_05890 [Armatimonadaceae bacterium]
MTILERYFAASDTEAEAVLEELFRRELLPALERCALQAGIPADRVSLVVSDATIGLITFLRSQRAAGLSPPANMPAYLRVTVENAETNLLRQHFTMFLRFKHRVRFVAENTPELVSWGEQGTRLVSVQSPEIVRRSRVSLQDDPVRFEPPLRAARIAGFPEDSKALRAMLITLLRAVDAPVALPDLTETLARLFDLDHPDDIPLDADYVSPASSLADALHAPDTPNAVLANLANQELLSRVWAEMRALRPLQRAALLLSLRDAKGRGILELLPEVQVASLSEIHQTLAEAMPLSEEQWERLRYTMPLPDGETARWLGTSIQNVRGLRRAARERLQRRLEP